jgi:trimeric autotransporter adhesin
MKTLSQRNALALAGLCLLTVYGCGDGGGAGSSTVPPVATSTSVPVTVIDDAIQFATVCLDKNKNGACDTGEPSGQTDAAGKVALQVDRADVGKFPILAVIGTDAVDAAYGPITTAFTMTAPADQTSVVSPLTTLVQTTVATTGVSSAEAAASLQSQTGLSVSLFQDFTKNTAPENKSAAVLARMIALITQQQSAALNSTVGSTAIDGALVTTADLNQIIQNKVLEILPEIMTSLQSSAVQGALNTSTTPAELTATLQVPAAAIVLDPATGLTSASVATLVAINNQVDLPAPEPALAATAGLRVLTFSSIGNWSMRGFTATAAQNEVDPANNRRYVQRQASSTTVGGTAVAKWNNGGTPARQSDLHFNGTAWAGCGLNGENLSSIRDAAGNSTYNFCSQRETGKSNRAIFDVSFKTMANVITEARAAGYANMSIGSNSAADFTSFLGTTVFPAGSSISYVSANSLVNAPAYYPGIGNIVSQADASVAAGRTNPNVAAPCSAATPPAATEAATFEGLIAVSTGTPCINFPGTATVQTSATTTAIVSSGARNEGWGSTSLSLGLVGLATTGGVQSTYYTTNTPLRVSFAAPNVARYYACQQRSTDGSNRNCNLVGSGSYSIASLGDARVMTFTGLPIQAGALTFERVFVERAGKVYFGYQNKGGVFNSARLNLAGGNALLAQLGIETVDPDTPLALTKASYAGDWQVSASATPQVSTLIRIFSNGTTSCTDTDTTNPAAVSVSAPYACVVTFSNLASGSFTLTKPADSAFSLNGTFSFLTGAASGTVGAGASAGSFAGARR